MGTIAGVTMTDQVQRISSKGRVRPDSIVMDIDAPEHGEGMCVSVMNLTFRYDTLYEETPVVLNNVTLQLEPGSRCLLLGANGAGKTTLLNVLGGKHIHPAGNVLVLGRSAFHNTHPGIISITGNWTRTAAYEGHSVSYAKDVTVQEMIDMAAPEHRDPARIARIVEVLDIDLGWRMHIVSDGQRRRVQLLMGLMKPWEVLLLDEVTVDLDVVARANLLQYLKEETEARGASIVYATHIFDGLDSWATHLARIRKGDVVKCAPVGAFEDYQALLDAKTSSPLLKTVTQWLRSEKEEDRAAASTESMQTDLKLNKYTEGVPFAHNRMYNRTV